MRLPLVIGTATLIAAFPPLGWWPLVVVAPIALTAAAADAPTGRAAFLRLWLVGLVFFGVVNLWLAETHWINYGLVGVISALYIGGYGWLAHRVLSRGASPLWLPVLWTAHEMVRLSWPLNGYPWQFVGHAVAASPVLVQSADLGGVLLLTFLVTTVSGGLLAHLQGRRGAGVAVAALVFLFVYGLVRPSLLAEPEPGPLLAAIQPGFAQHLKDNPLASEDRMAVLAGLTHEAVTSSTPPDLVVWPETMWPYAVSEGPGAEREERLMATVVSRLVGAAEPAPNLLLGALVRNLPEGSLSNVALYYDGAGKRLGRYDKFELVPGGETLPLIGWLPAGLAATYRQLILDMAGYVPDLRPGEGPSLMELDGRPFGVTICYENAYGSYCREFVRQGATFLVNISNEGWFGRSTEFDHMELQSVLRAVESRRALFRATNTGISCLVRPDGRRPAGADRLVSEGRDRDVAGLLVARIPLHTDRTLYAAWGDWIGWVCLVGAAMAAVRPRVS